MNTKITPTSATGNTMVCKSLIIMLYRFKISIHSFNIAIFGKITVSMSIIITVLDQPIFFKFSILPDWMRPYEIHSY